jgi:hypothetical protein
MLYNADDCVDTINVLFPTSSSFSLYVDSDYICSLLKSSHRIFYKGKPQKAQLLRMSQSSLFYGISSRV